MSWRLNIEFLSYWHVGNGLGEGAAADAVVLKDRHGLPYFPGKGVRGLLRNALQKADALGWLPDSEEDIITLAFGSSHLADTKNGNANHQDEKDIEKAPETTPKSAQETPITRLTLPGMLYVSNATLPDAERHYLAQPQQAHLRPGLYQVMTSTAIDADRGAAKKGSLRAFEVTVPLTLHAELSVNNDMTPEQKQQLDTALQLALPLIEHMGAKRSRGFGRVALELEKELEQEQESESTDVS